MSTKSIFTGFAWTGVQMVDVHKDRFEVLPGPEIWRVMNSWAVLRKVLPELKYREVVESQPLFVLPVTDLEIWRGNPSSF